MTVYKEMILFLKKLIKNNSFKINNVNILIIFLPFFNLN